MEIMESVKDHVSGLIQKDDSLTNPNMCRTSVDKLVSAVKSRFPDAKVVILVYPEIKSDKIGVHYALSVNTGDEEILINPVKTGLFPEYIGPKSLAAPTFSMMKETQLSETI